MNWFLKYKLHHIIFWLIYFIFWTYFSMHNYGTSLLSALLGTFIYFLGQAGYALFLVDIFVNEDKAAALSSINRS